MPSFANDDRIHGLNPIYRAEEGRFAAFTLLHGRPDQFRNQQVPGTTWLDHQGHILSQEIIEEQIADHATRAAERMDVTSLATLANFLIGCFGDFGYESVCAYAAALDAEDRLFDDDADGLQRVRGFFSLIVWNPANICRAPEDAHRGDYPENVFDNVVAAHLVQGANENAEGILPIPDLLRDGFDGASRGNWEPRTLLVALNNTLRDQINVAHGYYQFQWGPNEPSQPVAFGLP
jgi:hypothetical protein